jgi:hypothetical protein
MDASALEKPFRWWWQVPHVMRLLPESRGSNHSRKPSSTLAWVTGLSFGAGISLQGALSERAATLVAIGAPSASRRAVLQPERAMARPTRAMRREVLRGINENLYQ